MKRHLFFRIATRLDDIHRLGLVVLLTTVVAGCGGTAGLQRGLMQRTMEYEKHPTEYNLTDLAHSYAELLENQLGDTVQPGYFAEYGVTLALLGKHSEANRMFNNEVLLYPNAQRYVRQLKLQLVPEYISDTVSDTSTLYIIELQDTIADTKTFSAKDSIQQAKALQRKLREEAKRQQAESKKANVEERDLVKSIRAKEKAQREEERAAAKEAKEQAKKEVAKLKKEAAKQKERDKKAAEKAKAEQRKEQQRAREAAREQRARERAEARAHKENQHDSDAD